MSEGQFCFWECSIACKRSLDSKGASEVLADLFIHANHALSSPSHKGKHILYTFLAVNIVCNIIDMIHSFQEGKQCIP